MIKNINKYLMVVSFAIAAGCAADEVLPTLREESEFEAPVLTSPATADVVEFTPETANSTYETFTWDKSEYGANLSTAYVIQIDNDEDFSSPANVVTTAQTSYAVTVKQFNDAMLALGIPGFSEGTVYVRVISTANGLDFAPLYSNAVERTATTYQASDCGNFCTVALVGSATPGGWDVDTDLRLLDPTRTDKFSWTITLYLTAGEAKFRANDNWDVNWGATDFPSGTGTQNGSNIPIANAGYYKIVFNDESGEYTFTALTTPEYASIGLIGEQSGWANDIADLTKDGSNPHLWTGEIALSAGKLKFRANDAWDNNWGGDVFPSGPTTGNDLTIPVAATYFVRFNDATGEYSFNTTANQTPYTTVGLIGPAQSGGWDADTDLVKNPSNPYLWSKTLTITEGEAKFRANDAWDVNWGAGTFPSGVATQNGANIPTQAGTYFVTFNSGTGEYTFLK